MVKGPMEKSIKKIELLGLGTSLIIFLSIGPALTAATQKIQDTESLADIDYKIGAKDLLEIRVFELPELNQTVRVSEDGTVTFGILGKVEVAGLSAQELEQRLASILDQRYTKGAHVSVFIREFQKVAILGAVSRPGMYELVGPTTLLHMISQAGGLTGQAMKEIYVYRKENNGEKAQIVVSLDDLLKGSPDQNILLQPKDEIVVPVDQTLTVFVYGEVTNPGAITYLKSKRITLLQAIAQAGGTSEWARKSRVLIKRRDPKSDKEMQIAVDLGRIINGRTTDIYLQEGDVVIVP